MSRFPARDGSSGGAQAETDRLAPWVHPAPGRDGAHVRCCVVDLQLRLVLTRRRVLGSHQTGLGLMSTEQERGGAVMEMRHCGPSPAESVDGTDTVIMIES